MANLKVIAVLLGVICAIAVEVDAQGSIWGYVFNEDMSVPADGAVEFFGFIRNQDDEIHIHSCLGAGYESGHWYDDFQNYTDEAPHAPYRYFFFNRLNGQVMVLDSSIPSNSFEEVDITLKPGAWPNPPQNVYAFRQTDGPVRVQWDSAAGVTWHVYRRAWTSEGSFFRIDNPSGNLSDHGETVPHFVDTDLSVSDGFNYVVIAEAAGVYSPPSEVVEVDLNTCCEGIVGDVNMNGMYEPTLGDITLLIDHLFITLPPLLCLAEADANQSGGYNPGYEHISIGDIMVLIDHLYITLQPLPECL